MHRRSGEYCRSFPHAVSETITLSFRAQANILYLLRPLRFALYLFRRNEVPGSSYQSARRVDQLFQFERPNSFHTVTYMKPPISTAPFFMNSKWKWSSSPISISFSQWWATYVLAIFDSCSWNYEFGACYPMKNGRNPSFLSASFLSMHAPCGATIFRMRLSLIVLRHYIGFPCHQARRPGVPRVTLDL
jgi:hypothetical protein